MGKRLKKAWSHYRQWTAIRGLLQTLGVWKWIAAEVAILVSFLTVFWLQLPLWWQIIVGLSSCTFLLFVTGFAVAFWKVSKMDGSPSELDGPGQQSDATRGAIANTEFVSVPRPAVKQWKMFPRALEAVVESPLYIGQSGSVLAAVSIVSAGGHSQLGEITRQGRYSAVIWGVLERLNCEIPFRESSENVYSPASAEFRLITADFEGVQPQAVELQWNTASQVIEFLVKPVTTGVHKAQVQLWVRRHLRGAVVIQTEATSVANAGAGTGTFEMVATVDITFAVHGKQYTREREYISEKEHSQEHRHEQGFGISM